MKADYPGCGYPPSTLGEARDRLPGPVIPVRALLRNWPIVLKIKCLHQDFPIEKTTMR
jgi:hypothetical protein